MLITMEAGIHVMEARTPQCNKVDSRISWWVTFSLAHWTGAATIMLRCQVTELRHTMDTMSDGAMHIAMPVQRSGVAKDRGTKAEEISWGWILHFDGPDAVFYILFLQKPSMRWCQADWRQHAVKTER